MTVLHTCVAVFLCATRLTSKRPLHYNVLRIHAALITSPRCGVSTVTVTRIKKSAYDSRMVARRKGGAIFAQSTKTTTVIIHEPAELERRKLKEGLFGLMEFLLAQMSCLSPFDQFGKLFESKLGVS